MSIHNYLSKDIPTLKFKDTGSEILNLMKEWQVSELPLVHEGAYVALITEEYVLGLNNVEQEISNADFLNFKPSVLNGSHPYKAACRISELDLSVLPVVDDKNNFLGVLTRADLLAFFCDNSGLIQPGGIIILSMLPINYSLSEISRICENNDTIILNLQIFTDPHHNMIDVILKTNTKDLQGLKSSFERYEYIIKETYGETPVQNDMENRYKLLMNFINM